MAKKQTDTPAKAEKAAPEAEETSGDKEPKRTKEPKDKPEKTKAPKGEKIKEAESKEDKAPEGKVKEEKTRAAKQKEGKAKEPKPKTAPGAPAAGTAPAVQAPAATVPTAAGKEPSVPEAGKKRGAPGIAPPRGKKLRNHLLNLKQRILKEGPFPLSKAITFLKENKRSKFDETVEVHISLGIDTSQSEQVVRGSVGLPHGIGKPVRLAVFCQGDNVSKAKEAGADFVGSDELIKKIQGGWLDFDVALATQDMMGQVSRLGKVLGPRGLMPTPKAGTVITGDITAAVKEFKTGKVEYRADKGGQIHAGVGKLSFDEKKLADNIGVFVEQVRASKPAGVKGNYVKSIALSATMSPGITVTV
jgi:large subunit ribosomal protein L1